MWTGSISARSRQSDLRDKIGYVPQKGMLFSGTIESNLRYADENASQETLQEAADIAQASEFIFAKPEGFEAEIAQGGANVSGGQKQRLAIARALVKKPPIYIFDDSFSALDFKTDSALRRALKEKTGDSTVLIVTQRVATVKNADQIIVLEEGEVVGKGKPSRADGELRDLPGDCPVAVEQGGTGMSAQSHDNLQLDAADLGSGPGRGRGPMGRGGPMAMMKGEKARDFKGTMRKLIQYLGAYKIAIVIVMLFAVASTIFTIVGPKILGKATTKLFEGVMGQIAGTGAGIDFRLYRPDPPAHPGAVPRLRPV